jgi:hypothetical protein
MIIQATARKTAQNVHVEGGFRTKLEERISKNSRQITAINIKTLDKETSAAPMLTLTAREQTANKPNFSKFRDEG